MMSPISPSTWKQSDFNFFEFYRPAEIIRRGEAAARREIGVLLESWRERQAAEKAGH